MKINVLKYVEKANKKLEKNLKVIIRKGYDYLSKVIESDNDLSFRLGLLKFSSGCFFKDPVVDRCTVRTNTAEGYYINTKTKTLHKVYARGHNVNYNQYNLSTPAYSIESRELDDEEFNAILQLQKRYNDWVTKLNPLPYIDEFFNFVPHAIGYNRKFKELEKAVRKKVVVGTPLAEIKKLVQKEINFIDFEYSTYILNERIKVKRVGGKLLFFSTHFCRTREDLDKLFIFLNRKDKEFIEELKRHIKELESRKIYSVFFMEYYKVKNGVYLETNGRSKNKEEALPYFEKFKKYII